MAHAAAHIKKARVELVEQQGPDLKALEKARQRRIRSRERAERKRKVRGIDSSIPIMLRLHLPILISTPPDHYLSRLRVPAHPAIIINVIQV